MTVQPAEGCRIAFQSYKSALISLTLDVLNHQRASEQLFLLSPLDSDTSPFL